MTRRSAVTALLSGPGAGGAHSLTRLVSSARGSVVPLGTFSALTSPRFAFRGTGFVVGDGSIIATCFHVLPDVKSDVDKSELVVQMRGPAGETLWRPCRVLAHDRARDLCLLRLEGQALQALALASDHEAESADGAPVAFIGFPIGGFLGFSPVIHHGIISSHVGSTAVPPVAGQLTERAIASARTGAFEILQLDATAYPGNSGGPLFNADSGNVVGVISMVLIKGTREAALSAPTGITYAVPVQYLSMLLRSL